MKRLRAKLTYANVVATLALFIALAGGTAVAARHLLPKNSVGTKQLKNNSITSAKVKDGAITGSKIALPSLGAVPDAAHADSAETAQSATTAATAANATNATNAQALQGMSPAQIAATAKLACPTGTSLVAGSCFENAERTAATWESAVQVCGKADRTLPNTTQLATFDILNNNTNVEWTADLQWFRYESEYGYRAIAMYMTAGTSYLSQIEMNAGTKPYRCIVPPAN